MTERIPALVLALSDQVQMSPIAWAVHPDKVVIVFAEGPKMTFDRIKDIDEPASKPIPPASKPAPKPAPPASAGPKPHSTKKA